MHDQPGIPPETLSKVVKAVIKIQKARSGANFLDKLMQLDEHDIDGLDRLLGQWTVEDALTVLDGIDSRLSIIAAMEKLSGDPEADELHTLHPLVTQDRSRFRTASDRFWPLGVPSHGLDTRSTIHSTIASNLS